MHENFSFNHINNALAVGINLFSNNFNDAQNSLEELKFLAKTLGISIKKSFIQNRKNIDSSYYIGKGKLQEIKDYIQKNHVDAVLFDVELTGIQERNLEKFLDVTIFGRTELILNIFNKHAKTKEAKLQVQLACLEYMMPRLRNRWDHFSRVEGGIGLRGGEGEKQIELDRRMVQNQIKKVKDKLKKVDVQMQNRRKKRIGENIVSIIGYTNAGKSTLFNQLSKSSVFTENMLFSTLDATIRKVYINDNLTVLLSDTIGFINKLPHNLVASFKSTLQEIINSKLIIHVIDASSTNLLNNIKSVENIINDIGAHDIQCIRVFNKIDLLENGKSDCIINTKDHDVYISALKRIGIDNLKEKISNFFITAN